MAESQITATPQMIVTVENNEDLSFVARRFEWMSFANGGYMVRGTFADTYWKNLKDGGIDDYLQKARREGVPMTFQVKVSADLETEKRRAIMSHLEVVGGGTGGYIKFVAIDPPSFFLNSGDADGSVFEGNVSAVIKKVVSNYSQGRVRAEISETQDNKANLWWMYRQDPKTFIRSLLEFSSSLTNNRSNWIIATSDDPDTPGGSVLRIKEQAEMEKEHFGDFTVTTGGTSDVKFVEFLGDNMISPLQTAMITGGISATTGQVIGQPSKKDPMLMGTIVNDENTKGKKKPIRLTPKNAFSKPNPLISKKRAPGATYVRSVPEFSAGDIGKKYDQWIDGRARGLFMDMLNMVMRVKATLQPGDVRFSESEKLGVATVGLVWPDGDRGTSPGFFVNGRWLLYGFHHDVTPMRYRTHLYLARLDHDALAVEV